MSNASYDPQTDWRGCGDARYNVLDSITNADMDGIAVAVANIVLNVCFRILVTWSPEEVDVAVQASLIHVYSILLSTLFSILLSTSSSTPSQQLSLFDANYALQVCSSPLTVYLVAASICDLCGTKTGLYKRIKSHRRTTRALGALVPFLWLGLSMTMRLSNRAFVDSGLCDSSTFTDWLLDLVQSIFYSIQAPGSLSPFIFYSIFGPIFGFCAFRVRSRVMSDVRAYWDGASRPWGRLCILWVLVRSTWCAIDRKFKSCVYLLFAALDSLWAFQVILYAIVASQALNTEYVLSYGQVLSMFATIPTLSHTVKFVLLRCRGPKRFLRFLSNIRPDPPVQAQGSHLPFNVTSHPEKPTLGKMPGRIVISARPAYRPPLSPELDSAMWSGWGWNTESGASCATNTVCDAV